MLCRINMAGACKCSSSWSPASLVSFPNLVIKPYQFLENPHLPSVNYLDCQLHPSLTPWQKPIWGCVSQTIRQKQTQPRPLHTQQTPTSPTTLGSAPKATSSASPTNARRKGCPHLNTTRLARGAVSCAATTYQHHTRPPGRSGWTPLSTFGGNRILLLRRPNIGSCWGAGYVGNTSRRGQSLCCRMSGMRI
jgi:hypothetical protein